MKKLLIALLLGSVQMFYAQDIKTFIEKSDYFFRTSVINGKVNYQDVSANPEKINELLTIASKITLESEDIDTYKAFWINAYNIVVIKEIANKYPVISVQALKGFFDTSTNIAGQDITLNQIEKKILKNTFNDPLINFVLVCGATGCPPLMDRAYTPSNLKSEMMERIMLSINNKDFVKVNDTTKTIEISEIFDWYKEEFINKENKIIDFINQYRTKKIDETYTIKYYKYDWNLNSTK